MMNLKNITILILITLSLSVNIHSQTKAPDSSENTENYKHEIQFYIVNQLIAAYKYNLSETSALRFRINSTGLFEDETTDIVQHTYYSTDTIITKTVGEEITSKQFFELTAHYLYKIKVVNRIEFYMGGGPFVNYAFWQRNGWSKSNDIFSGSYINQDYFWNTGISAVIGLECVLYDYLTIFTEYEAAVSRGWHKVMYEQSSTFKHTYDLWGYEMKGLRIGIGVSF